tara:strand:- start:354 stop:1277 length:924 start_codon:yes stop_codon:yes gene_type:complete
MSVDFNKKIYGYNDLFNFFIKLDEEKRIPNKFILSGNKGIGKSTFAYHLINYILSKNEKNKYDTTNYKINDENKSYRLIKNLSHPNFLLIDVDDGKQQISIDKIRKSFDFINKSSMNNDFRIILIDNAEYLNQSSGNALLKVIEEPNEKLIFILVHDISCKLLDTIKSRCIIFKKAFSCEEKISIFEKIVNQNFTDIFKNNFLFKFMSIGELIYLKKFSEECKLKEKIDNKNILNIYLKDKYNKDNKKTQKIMFKLMQIYLFQINMNSFSEKNFMWYNSFFKKVTEANIYNLDIGNLYFEFQKKMNE